MGRGGRGAGPTQALADSGPAAASVSEEPAMSGAEVWAAWGFSTFAADRTIVAMANIPGPDVKGSMALYAPSPVPRERRVTEAGGCRYFEVWNLCRYQGERSGGTAEVRVEELASEFLPRSLAWLRDSLRWVRSLPPLQGNKGRALEVEFLLAAPDWTIQQLKTFLQLSKEQRVAAYVRGITKSLYRPFSF